VHVDHAGNGSKAGEVDDFRIRREWIGGRGDAGDLVTVDDGVITRSSENAAPMRSKNG
jgi:hypothetical protein